MRDAEPVVVRRRQRVVVNEPSFVQQVPSQVNIGNNSGNNSGNGNVIGGLADALGGLGGGGGGGDIGGGDIGGGAAVPPPVVDPLHARISGLESGIKEGIASSAITQPEAALLSLRLGQIQAQRANLGDTPASRLVIQRQLDAAVADFNNKAHNNNGIPNPALFRSFARPGATATLNGQAPNSRFAALRARLAAKNGQVATAGPTGNSRFAALRARLAAKNGQVATTGQVGNSRFAAMRARIAAARNGTTVGQTGNSRFAKFLERRRQQQAGLGNASSRRCFRAPCNGSGSVATTTTGGSFKNRFVQRRIAQIRQSNAGNTNATPSRISRQIVQRRATTSVSSPSRTDRVKSFLARRMASAR